MGYIVCPKCGSYYDVHEKECTCCKCSKDEYRRVEKIILQFPKYKGTGLFGTRTKKDYVNSVCERTGLTYEIAEKLTNNMSHPVGMDFSLTKEQKARVSAERWSGTSAQLSSMKKDNVARCPKCKSTSISYDTKKLSVGRGVVGGLIGSTVNPIGTAVGVTVGGLSSKKGYCVCLNCGKRWKI